MEFCKKLSYFKAGCKIVLAHTRKICYDNKNTHKKEKVMSEPRRRLTRYALHGKEEWFKRVFRDQIAEAAGILEVVLSGIVLVALLLSIVPLVELMPGLLTDAESIEVHTFLERALDIVIGIEFIKMLAKHSPGSVLEVLLYAIARHMIVGHEDAVQNLVSVGAIALIFIIRKYFFVPSFGQKLPGGDTAPDLAEKSKE